MIVVEFFCERSDGVKLYRSYSSEGLMIERDGEVYEEAVDPEGSCRTYAETDIPIQTDTMEREASPVIEDSEEDVKH